VGVHQSLVIAFVLTSSTSLQAQIPVADRGVVRSTLSNGLRVVLVPNALAPVVTVETNFLVGGDDTLPGCRR
jgi:zinc protease